MLKTIYTIGKEISSGRDLWEDIIETKVEAQKEGIKYLVLNVVFDLDQNEIIISRDNLEEYASSFENLKELVLLKTLGRRMKSPYLCVDNTKIENLSKTLFGIPDKKGVYPSKGDLAQAIERDVPELTLCMIIYNLPTISLLISSLLHYFSISFFILHSSLIIHHLSLIKQC